MTSVFLRKQRTISGYLFKYVHTYHKLYQFVWQEMEKIFSVFKGDSIIQIKFTSIETCWRGLR